MGEKAGKGMKGFCSWPVCAVWCKINDVLYEQSKTLVSCGIFPMLCVMCFSV